MHVIFKYRQSLSICERCQYHYWYAVFEELNKLDSGSVLILVTDVPVPCLPVPCTVRYLVTNYLDIGCVPRRSFFEMLLYFAHDEREKEKLQEFTSSAGQVYL